MSVHASTPSQKVLRVVEAFMELSARELLELQLALKDRGVEPSNLAATREISIREPPETSRFDVVLTGIGPNRLQAIRRLHVVVGVGLREARTLADSVPTTLAEGLPREDGETMKKRLEEAGMVIALQ